MSRALDRHDLTLLAKVRDEGPQFFSRASHEIRACEMARDGLLSSAHAIYSVRRGGETIEFRTKYAITDAGRAALASHDKETGR